VAKAKYVHGRFFGLELCEMFGLDPGDVHEVVIRANVSDAAKVEVTTFLDRSKCDELVTRRFNLVEVTDV
jgi:hypothetical protein